MQVSVDEMLKPDDQPSQRFEKRASYFSLTDDGDSAIVRFLHQDINDFEVLDVHNIKLGGYNRKINCLKTPGGSKDECELCKANYYDEEKGTYTYPLQRKFFIHMLRYENPQTASEQVWERSKDYIKKLNQLVEDYGPLCDRLYKIVRHGAKGSMETTYDILPLDKDRFNPAQFVFDRNQLNYEKACGGIVLNESNEAIKEFLQTGNFPSFNKNVVAKQAQGESASVEAKPQSNTFEQQTQTQARVYNPANDPLGGSPRDYSQPSYYQQPQSQPSQGFSFDGPRRRV